MYPINKDEATISVSIKNAMEEYNLIDAPVRHLRPYVAVLDRQPWTGQSAADFITQTSTLAKSQVVAFQPLTQKGITLHGSAQTTACVSTLVQDSSYTPRQRQRHHKASVTGQKSSSVNRSFLCIGTGLASKTRQWQKAMPIGRQRGHR